MMGNVNQITPDGSLTYDQTGSYKFTDPYTGHSYDVPTFTATQTLSPEQQAIQDQTRGAQGNLASIANAQSGFLKDYLGQGVNTTGVPGLMGSAGQRTNIGGSYATSVGGGYDTSFDRNIRGNFTDKVDLVDTYAGADDFSADRQRVEDALWERGATGRAREEEGLRTRLLNSGLREGSAAWNAEMERLGRQVSDERIGTMLASGQEQSRLVGLARDAAMFGNDARLTGATFGNTASLLRSTFDREGQQLSNAAVMDRFNAQNAASMGAAQFANDANYRNAAFQNSARAQGLQEAYAARSQPINEIIGLMSGSQVQQPNFVNAQIPQIAGTDNAGIINDHYKQQLAAWQASQPNLGGLMTGIGGGIGKLIGMSDERTKKDVKKRGEIDGMGLYEFRYKGEPKSQSKHVGLMAQEVKKKRPEAIVPTSGGLMAVDYGKAVPGLMGGRQASR